MTRLPEAELDRKLNRALECGRGLMLRDSDLDMFAASGALVQIEDYCAYLREPEDFPAVDIRDYCPDCCTWIYFVQCGERGQIKIGHSKNPANRVIEMQTGQPLQLYLRAKFAGPFDNEAALHRFYEREHLRGEWFRPSPRLLAFVRWLNQWESQR